MSVDDNPYRAPEAVIVRPRRSAVFIGVAALNFLFGVLAFVACGLILREAPRTIVPGTTVWPPRWLLVEATFFLSIGVLLILSGRDLLRPNARRGLLLLTAAFVVVLLMQWTI